MTGFLRRYLTFAFARRRRPRKRSFTQRLVGRRGWHYFGDAYGVLQESSAPRADEHAIWDTLRSRNNPSHKCLESPKPNYDRLAFVVQLPDCS
jgi:hypothetical protein